jgi:hypothetical protein
MILSFLENLILPHSAKQPFIYEWLLSLDSNFSAEVLFGTWTPILVSNSLRKKQS